MYNKFSKYVTQTDLTKGSYPYVFPESLMRLWFHGINYWKHWIIFLKIKNICCCSALGHLQLLRLHGWQHARLPCPSLSPGVCSNSCQLSQWCNSTISFSVAPFSSCPQSFPASGSFLMNQIFTSCGQIIEASINIKNEVKPVGHFCHSFFFAFIYFLINLF